MIRPTQKTLRGVVWRRIMDDCSFEECVVTSSPEGFGIAGRVIAAEPSSRERARALTATAMPWSC